MIQVSITKLYAACVAIMVLIPISSFNSNTEGAKNEKQKESAVLQKIKIEKMKIDLELKRATYSEGISNVY